MLNGKPLQSDPSVILGQLPANAIKNIEVVTAPSAKYDPEGKAGIINITTEKGATDGTFIQFNTRIGAPSIEDYDNKEKPQRYGADFTLNHRKGDWDFSLGASYLRNDINGRREGDVYTIRGDTITRFPRTGSGVLMKKPIPGALRWLIHRMPTTNLAWVFMEEYAVRTGRQTLSTTTTTPASMGIVYTPCSITTKTCG